MTDPIAHPDPAPSPDPGFDVASDGSPGFGPVAHSRTWPAEASELIGRDWSASRGRQERWVVRGGPGSGKTTLIMDVMRAAIVGGVSLDGMLVLTGSARAAAELVEETTRGLPPAHVVGTDAPVRTVHSLAHAVVRLAAARVDAPPPRLRTGAEHDAVIRETLIGELADGAPHWPEQIRPALATVGFARELRDLLLRSLERGIGPRELAGLGRSAGRPTWVAAAGFFRRHEEQMALRSGVRGGESDMPEALNAAELVSAALDALTADPDLRDLFRSRRLVAVDDAHHLDPLAAEFVATIGGGADVLLVAEDGDQSVFRFRGADGGLARAVIEQGGRVLDLTQGRRMQPAVAAVAARVASRLPGASRHRPRETPAARHGGPVAADAGIAAAEGAGVESPGAEGAAVGSVEVAVAGSASAEATLVADFLRRRHVLDGVGYGEMAIVTRSLPRVADALLVALDAAGVPVVDAGAELPPAHDPVVAALLLLLRSVVEPEESTDEERILTLLAGPIGRADAVAMRRLRRGIRRSGIGGAEPSATTLRGLVLAEDDRVPPGLTVVELAPVTRIRYARAAVRSQLRAGGSVEEVLWAAWSSARLERRLVRQALAVDAWSRSADRSLDAVVSLFDHAADFVDRTPGGSVVLFCEIVSGADLPAPRRADTRGRAGAVSILSAHAAVGRQWRSVAVCGVQDGVWPAPRRRSGLLGVDELVDLTELAGDGPLPSETERAVSSSVARSAEERRLFYVACSRAREHLLITAVESPDEGDVAPSRFVDEVADLATVATRTGPVGPLPGPARHAPTVFTLPHLAVDLRAALLDPDTDPADVEHAAGLLAGLRDAGVGEADPRTWFGAAEPSTMTPAFPIAEGEPIAVLSPSAFGALEECPLRWFLQKIQGDSSDAGSAAALVRGSAVHALTQAVEGAVSEDEIRATVSRRAESLTFARGWFAEKGAESMVEMAETFRRWRAATRGEYTTAGVEEPFEFDVAGGVRVRGRIDRLEATDAGQVVPVDIKTGRSVVSTTEALVHPQLALYQLAVERGAVASAAGRGPGGGLLLYLAGREGRLPTDRVQDPLGPETAEALTERIVEAGRSTTGPEYTARVGAWCDHCAVRSSCPAQPQGEQVIE